MNLDRFIENSIRFLLMFWARFEPVADTNDGLSPSISYHYNQDLGFLTEHRSNLTHGKLMDLGGSRFFCDPNRATRKLLVCDGFKYVLFIFSPIPGDMIQFDWNIFFKWVETRQVVWYLFWFKGPRCLDLHTLRRSFLAHGTESWPFGIRRYESEELCEAAKKNMYTPSFWVLCMQARTHVPGNSLCPFGDG